MRNTLLKSGISFFCAAGFMASAATAEYKTGAFPTTFAAVKALPSVNSDIDDCSTQWDDEESPYCILASYDKNSKDIFVEAYLMINKDEVFTDERAILDHFMQFDKWPVYVTKGRVKGIPSFTTSKVVRDETLPNGDRLLAHFYDYKADAGFFNIGVKGTATYRLLATPAPNALLSADFSMTKTWGEPWELITPMPDGSNVKGTRGHDANFHIVAADFDGSEAFLVVYRTRARLKITLSPLHGARSLKKTVETLLTGMFLPE